MSTNMDPHAVAVGPDSVSPSAPSPSLSPASGATPIKTEPSDGKPSGPNSARRPPRKSTLTQQQKNQKRQRATQDQLATLEMEFSKNPTPTADVRDRIADEINMTQRSVQIWFQNRRAKIKLMAKKHLENGEDLDSIPESMRQYLAMQAIESGKGLAGGFLGRSGLLPCGNGMLMGGDPTGQSKVLIQHLTCRALSIGTWTRVGQNMMDLIVFYSPEKCTMTYYINNEQAGYKIEYPFAYIKNICLENNEGDPSKPAGIVIELNHPPHFFMDSSANAQGFYQVADFTEDMQASRCLVHRLGGSPKVLSGQLAKLVSLESFMNRHIQQQPPMFESHALSASAPVSPTARPSSQPNFQQPHVGMYQESWGAPPNAPPPSGMRGPGHKRQRSRSVPMPVDFSMFQAPMPSFYIQQPGEAAPQQGSPNIFAPAPQQPTSAPGSNLRIDTQAGFGLDMRQYPMSATTASPSEFSSPNFFAQGSESTPLPVNTPYSGTFLSPMPNPSNLVPPSVSPLPFNGPTEPSIVEQSPPMTMAGRPASADAYQLNDGSCAVSDDGANLGDMYSKQNMSIPMHSHSPAHFDQQHPETDMSHLVQFDSADHASVSPEAMTQGTSQSGMHAVTPQTAQ